MDASLFEIAKESQIAGEPATIGLMGFKFLLSSLIDTAIAQKQPTSLWVKLPSAEVWQAELERYCQPGSDRHLYCYMYDRRIWSGLIDSPRAKKVATPIVFENPNLLKGEFFILLLSSEFSVCVIAQRTAQTTEATGKRAQLSTVITSDRDSLIKVASGLKALSNDANVDILEAIGTQSSSPLSQMLTRTLLQVLSKQDEAKQGSSKAVNAEESVTAFSSFTPTIGLIDRLLEELRTPLTTMKTALKLVGSENLKPPQRQRYVEMLNAQCDRQTSLVSGLLEFIQLQQAIEQASLQTLKLSDIIPVVVSTYQPLAQEKGVQLGYTVSDKLPEIIGFEPWLKQIVIHLLHNSIKFTPSGGRVSVVATPKDRFVELEVRDTGISIPTQDLTQIFDWFYRTKNTGEGENTGSGIGLAIVQNLLESCGGSISVISRMGQGSTFKVLLPTC